MSIEIKGVHQAFHGKVVLDNLNLTIEPNKIYGLLGRNGAGKSTLLNIISDRVPARSGAVTMDGQSVHENNAALGNLYLMSEVNLYPPRNKVDQLFKKTANFYGGFDTAYAHRLAGEFGLDLNARFGKLSTGYRSIFKLIIALCVPVDYVFLDEPVLGLDANHRDLFYQELLSAYGERPRTFVISTHLIEEVANLIEHVFVLDDHRIIINGDVSDVLAKAYAISGPQADVDRYTAGLNIIGADHLAGIAVTYVYGTLDNSRPIPDTVQVANQDLQKLFINLTNTTKEVSTNVN
ncbi:ATP-binding cassette domain-containing protein [Lactiplantibacillus plajomi]|uniref:ATP-binding cassette domain-containing protein n=1 Tax=Lactiplantibacillus plajomi TaxID=1457217 RepID=A0ABV6K442_9LACO|nr:ABC transporter ATP-binding protein [Lactiplantibacillus plajomi]